MLASVLENGSSISKVATVLDACKKILPRSGAKTPDAQLNLELERLALSAPHMLADIGFERDFKVCSHEKTVWRRGTVYVTIFCATHAAAVSI